MRFKLKREKEKNPEEEKQQSKKRAQDWLPFYDVAGNFIFRKDDNLVAVLRISPINIALRSDSEKKRIIQAIHEVWNAQLEPIQIISIPRPVDLDQYFEQLLQKSKDASNLKKKKLLRDYTNYVAGLVRSGEVIERRYYILISQKKGKNAKEELLQRAYEIANNLRTSGLNVVVADDKEILDMLFSFLQPAQAAFEEPPIVNNITTIYKEGER